jgi:hypothetical protein
MQNLFGYLRTFILAGFVVSGISYLGNEVNPLLAGILSGIPISIPSMLLIKNDSNKKKFIWSATVLVAFLGLVTFICWLLLTKLNFSPIASVGISFLLWIAGAVAYYFIIVKKITI